MIAFLSGEKDTTLKGLVSRHCDQPAFVEGYSDPDRMDEQCAWDSTRTMELLPILLEKMPEGPKKLYYELERPLLPLWTKMTLEGSYRLDRKPLEKHAKKLEKKVLAQEIALHLEFPPQMEVDRCLWCAVWKPDMEEGTVCHLRPKKAIADRLTKWMAARILEEGYGKKPKKVNERPSNVFG